MDLSEDYSFANAIEALDRAIDLLDRAVLKLKSRQVNTANYRIRYDNYVLTLGLACQALIKRARLDLITDQGASSLALLSVRTMHDLCITKAAVHYSENKLTKKQSIGLRQARLFEVLASEKDIRVMIRLVNDEADSIGGNTLKKHLLARIRSYNGGEHYARRGGFYRELNDAAWQKVENIYNQLDVTITKQHPVFINFLHDEVYVIFSNLLHGNLTGVLVAADKPDKRLTIPFMLLRVSLYDAELITDYVNDYGLKNEVIALREEVLKRAYGG